MERLEHRAGKDAEGKTGDGVGIMLQISHKFFSKVADELNISLGNEREYGVGMFFFPQNEHLRAQAMKLFELVTRKEGLEFLAWRRVPVDPDAVGQKARDCMPSIWQCFIKKPARVSKGIDFDRRLYIVRRVFEQASNGTYVPSLSSRTIVYKGMFLVHDLRLFYLDLQDEDYESAIGDGAQPLFYQHQPQLDACPPQPVHPAQRRDQHHQGNTDAMLAREESIESPILQDDMNKILPIINTSGSDSAMLDNALEFMVMNGMDLPLAVMITIPEPWENNKNISQKKRDFYQYYATMLEPWDGPAAILFSDGDVVGAVLDRNGLRPSRYYITKDGRMILSSEVGVLPCAPDNILMKDRLRPGKMLLVDTVKGEVVDDEKLKEYYASREPYGEWIDRNLVRLKDLKIPNIKVPSYTGEELTRLQKVFGYKYEEIKELILPMARAGAEPSGAMGTDTPLAVLSDQHPPLFNYFKQRFAQVTNPPIDAIREKVVTSTSVYVGAHGNLLEDKPENCKVLKVQNPILTSTDLLKIKHMNVPGFKTATVPSITIRTPAWKRLSTACSWRWTAPTRTVPTSSSSLTATSTSTTSPSPACWLFLPCPSTSSAPRRARPWPSSLRAPSPTRCTTLPPCWATVPVPSTPICPRHHCPAHRRGSAGQGLLRRRGRLQQGCAERHREDRLQNGHLHHPELPEQPDL